MYFYTKNCTPLKISFKEFNRRCRLTLLKYGFRWLLLRTTIIFEKIPALDMEKHHENCTYKYLYKHFLIKLPSVEFPLLRTTITFEKIPALDMEKHHENCNCKYLYKHFLIKLPSVKFPVQIYIFLRRKSIFEFRQSISFFFRSIFQ